MNVAPASVEHFLPYFGNTSTDKLAVHALPGMRILGNVFAQGALSAGIIWSCAQNPFADWLWRVQVRVSV